MPTNTSQVQKIQTAALDLLDDSDNGRVWQQTIDEATAPHSSTVSKGLSELEDGGEIVVLSFGRRNLVTLPDAVPEAWGGPDVE